MKKEKRNTNLSRWQDAAEILINSLVKVHGSENFMKFAVNVYPDQFNNHYFVNVTAVMRKPFGKDDSETLQNKRFEIPRYIKDYLPNLDKDMSVSFNTEIVDLYNERSKPWYDERKKQFQYI